MGDWLAGGEKGGAVGGQPGGGGGTAGGWQTARGVDRRTAGGWPDRVERTASHYSLLINVEMRKRLRLYIFLTSPLLIAFSKIF